MYTKLHTYIYSKKIQKAFHIFKIQKLKFIISDLKILIVDNLKLIREIKMKMLATKEKEINNLDEIL